EPEWTEERPDAAVVALEPLSEEESAVVVGNVLGQSDLDAAVKERIIRASGGNPLFVEQVVSMMADEGVLSRGEDGRWVLAGDAGAITIPPSINALLTARLDRLGPVERTIVERAA